MHPRGCDVQMPRKRRLFCSLLCKDEYATTTHPDRISVEHVVADDGTISTKRRLVTNTTYYQSLNRCPNCHDYISLHRNGIKLQPPIPSGEVTVTSRGGREGNIVQMKRSDDEKGGN